MPRQSFRRGQEYYQDSAVISLVRRGSVLQAEVEGSQPEPYQVRLVADAAGITEASCDCPYDWGGWCKHIVATLLACIDEPESVEERPTVEEMLTGLDREQLLRLLLRLANSDPSVADILDGEIPLLVSNSTETPTSTAQPHTRRTALDTGSIRHHVRAILHSLDHLRKAKSHYPRGQVEVLLHEGLVADAIDAVDGSSSYELIEQVVDAAIELNPEWVIRTCRRQAEPIIEGGKAQYYDHAVRWLAKARDERFSAARDG